MALRSKEEWIELLSSNGIPDDKSEEYANAFITNELCSEDIAELGRDGLKEIGISVLGHSMKILRLSMNIGDLILKLTYVRRDYLKD